MKKNETYNALIKRVRDYIDISYVCRELSIEAIELLQNINVSMDSTHMFCMLDGGVSFEFSINNDFFLIDIFNDGEMVLLKDDRLSKPQTWDFASGDMQSLSKAIYNIYEDQNLNVL